MPKLTPQHYRILRCIFEKAGFVYQRTKGDHTVYTKAGVLRPLVIPLYKAIPIFIIKNLIRTSGISREDYFDYLQRCQ